MYSPTVEIVKHSSNVTVVFADGPSIMVNLLTSGRLDFVLLVKKNRIDSPYGLLGNFNNVLEDDLMSFQYPLSEQEIYNISQTCELTFVFSVFRSMTMVSEEHYIIVFMQNKQFTTCCVKFGIVFCLKYHYCAILKETCSQTFSTTVDTVAANVQYFGLRS